jgi:hypothetical protein
VDVFHCAIKYGAGYTDYFLLALYSIPEKLRGTYITRRVNEKYINDLNMREYWDNVDDKIKFNTIYSAYLSREWVDLSLVTLTQFESFLQGRKKIVAKTVHGTGGLEVSIIELAGTDIQRLYHELMSKKQTLVEEFIVQHPKMNELYENSVNTLRVVTILGRSGSVNVVFAALRIGHCAQVDNLHSGGMLAIVDLSSGKVMDPAADRAGELFVCHPETGTNIVGFEVPFFKDTIKLVKSAAVVTKELRYVGWDVAFGHEGPMIIEANHMPGYDAYQGTCYLGDKRGVRERFDLAINS